MLELRRDGATTGLGIADEITDFQISFLMQDASTVTSFAATDDWSQIQRMQFTIGAERAIRNRTMTREMTADVFPRAILSN